jgi:hypothetical protein
VVTELLRASTLDAATGADETGCMVVVTVTIARDHREEVAVMVREHTVTISAANGYRHDVRLPLEADSARLHAELYDCHLELRAPCGPQPPERPVPVHVLR